MSADASAGADGSSHKFRMRCGGAEGGHACGDAGVTASAVVGSVNVSDCVISNTFLSSLCCLARGQFCVGAQAAWDAVTVLDLMNGCEVSVYVPMRALRHVDGVHFRRVDGCTICQPVQTRNRGNLAHYGSQCVRTLPLLVRFGHVAAL